VKLYDSKAIAKFLDVSERRVRQLRDEKVIAERAGSPRLYELLPTLRTYINYLRKKNPDSEESIDYNTERAKLVRAKRLNEEFDLKVKERELHGSEEIETTFSAILVSFKNRLLAIPSKLAPILSKKTDKAEIYKLLATHINEALDELSEFKGLNTETEGGADNETSDG
jgi:hypothetical protein